jgi:hypothetical protein
MPLTPADFDLIPDDDADLIFGNSKITRNRWRREGGGPPFIKIGRRIFYPRAKLAACCRGGGQDLGRRSRRAATLRGRSHIPRS